MAKVKGMVLQQNGRRIIVLTENGEFRQYCHRHPLNPGQAVIKREYGDLVVYVVAGLLLFALAAKLFHFLMVGNP